MAGRRKTGRRKPRTAAQRAALKKAQAASARKRRGRKTKAVLRGAGTIAGGLAVAGISHHANMYVRNPRSAVKDFNSIKGVAKRTFGKKTPSLAGGPLRKTTQQGGYRAVIL